MKYSDLEENANTLQSIPITKLNQINLAFASDGNKGDLLKLLLLRSFLQVTELNLESKLIDGNFLNAIGQSIYVSNLIKIDFSKA